MRTLVLLGILLAGCSPSSAQKQTSAQMQDGLPFSVVSTQTLSDPWAMTFLPRADGKLSEVSLITQRGGQLLYGIAGKQMTPVAGVPKVDDGGQGGLGDVIAHPAWASNGIIYLSWVEAGTNGTRGAVVGRAKLISDGATPRLEQLSIIWRQAPKVSGRGHFGHRMAFGPDGKLYVSSGDRQKFDPAQDDRGTLGKVIAMNDDGSNASIVSKGHRNPLGLAFDAQGQLWDSEMGPQGGDELNLVRAGANYGWPLVSNGSHYDGREIPDHAAGDGFEAPKVWWNPSISPGSLMFYSGDLFAAWKGSAFIGALGGEGLIRVSVDGANARIADQWAMGARIREVEQGPDGAIWVLEDGGRLVKLMPK